MNRFIVFDGIDGSGKTTQLLKLAQFLFESDKKVRVVLTREPTYGQFGKQIREMLASQSDPYESAEELTELYVQDREEHLQTLVEPALQSPKENHTVVLCDRYYYSTLTYQAAQGQDMNALWEKNNSFRKPDVSFLFDISPKTALARITKARSMEKFEEEKFMQKLVENFSKIAEVTKDPIVRIDAERSQDEMFEQIVHAYQERFSDT